MIINLPTPNANAKRLTADDWADAAAELKCEVAAIRAVADVESAGDSFLMSGRPKILFEAHIFGRLTNHVHGATHPGISSRAWNRALYKGGEGEYPRLMLAMTLNPIAACESASWGKFQIMGMNWKACGFSSVFEFVQAHYQSEAEQLAAFIDFLRSRRLDRHLISKNWAAFALGYNGPGYKANRYDTKMAEAYKRRAANV